MSSKNNEVEFYSTVYLLAFDKDKSFFYGMDSPAIYAFLTENYWGDSLDLRLKLLAKLFYFDSFVASKENRKELVRKSQELNEYLIQNQE
ncbi:MAG: hypothetical protein LBC48_08225 [Dysgonamonadaceae bacterium]|jgi:hypothetical protein|nr:hypothetical protein [Dysgonamonadaceae bacterium]